METTWQNMECTSNQKLSKYLDREKCPSCSMSVSKAQRTVYSTPAAEETPFHQHEKFLSGYTNKRIFFSYHRCQQCQLLYCPIYFTQTQLDQLYERQMENMADVPLQARYLTQKAYYRTLKKYHQHAGDYLEIGADVGLFAKFFAENPATNHLYLYEPNIQVHDILKSNVDNKNHDIFTKNYAAADIPFESLSTVSIIHTLDHILEPRELMRDVYKNLKPGGCVLIVTHDESSLLARLLKRKWPPYTLQHPHLFQPKTITALLQTEGFHVLACKKVPNYFPLTHFIKGGMTALGFEKFPLPHFAKFILPIQLGNILTVAQKPGCAA